MYFSKWQIDENNGYEFVGPDIQERSEKVLKTIYKKLIF